jgi:sulfur carrier protein ThiS
VKSLIKGVFIWLSIQLKIHIKLLPKNVTDEIDLECGSKMYDLLKKINLKPDNIIILRGNTPVPVDDAITEEQELTIIQVASGG